MTADARGAALGIRRWFLVASPVLAGLFAILGAAADPAVGQDGLVLYQAYATHPEPLQFKSFGFHWAYAFWTMTAFVLAGLAGAQGSRLASVAAVLAFVGATTLPGLLVTTSTSRRSGKRRASRRRRPSTTRWRGCGA